MVLVGDFFQLPPVSSSKFLFESPIFKEAAPSSIVLTDIYRQSDPVFIELLGRMRTGTMTEDDHDKLRSRVGADITKFDIMPTQLWSTNKDVDRINQDYLSQIKTPLHRFARHVGIVSDGPMESQKSQKEKYARDISNSHPEIVELKGPSEIDVGAQVMLCFNLDQGRGLVNGSRGVITGFAPFAKAEVAHFNDYEDKSVMYPKDVHLPLVRFLVNGNPLVITVPYVCIARKSTVESVKSVLFAWVMPLKLAWATTVHKSQGQSLECVKISLDNTVFENGQAYVAVSRARSLEGVTLSAYEPKVVRANELVKKYYETL
jgi:ATP-dependent DNA helicase PIF1